MGELFRRSGLAVSKISNNLGWQPDIIYQIGVGGYHKELDVFLEDWPDIKIYGCEPHPRVIRKIKKYPGVLHQVAITDQVGRAMLWDKARHRDGSSMVTGDDWEGKEVEVETTTLDVLFPKDKGFPRLGDNQVLLWLDCEGSEVNALKGGTDFIEGVDVVNVELVSSTPSERWGTPVEIYNLLAKHDFYIQWLHTQRNHTGQCDAIFVKERLFDPRLCCVPTEMARYEARDKK